MFLTNQQAHAYLLKYAKQFGLKERVRLNSKVEMISCGHKGSWSVESTTLGARRETEPFSHVIVASGRFNKPRIPQLRGLERFVGAISHTFDYRSNEDFKGKRVLVIGNGISGLEVASELANDPTVTVLSSCRKPRYIMSKIFSGLPADCLFTRFSAMLNRALSPERAAQALKDLILKQCGSPEQYGGLKPADDIGEANISLSQYYLAQVAEGKILPKKGVREVTENSVLFEDGSRETIDAIVFGTGYEMHLPFLAKDILEVINADGTHIDLYRHTFHPDLANLAFLGLYVQIGPYFPVLELQGRWIAMVWSGVKPLPIREKMLDGIREFQEWKMVHYETLFDEMAVMLSTEAGVAPTLDKHPELAKALLFGPLASSQFRLDGHGKHQGAAKEFVSATSSFGNITSPELTDEQMAGFTMLASALKDDESIAALPRMFQERSQRGE